MKKKKTFWKNPEKEEIEIKTPAKVADIVPEPVVEKPAVRCECGDFANPDSHQCWRCSHRT